MNGYTTPKLTIINEIAGFIVTRWQNILDVTKVYIGCLLVRKVFVFLAFTNFSSRKRFWNSVVILRQSALLPRLSILSARNHGGESTPTNPDVDVNNFSKKLVHLEESCFLYCVRLSFQWITLSSSKKSKFRPRYAMKNTLSFTVKYATLLKD